MLNRETITRATTLADQVITVTDPDNLLGSPAYHGLASRAWDVLVEGTYSATTEDGAPVTLLLDGYAATLVDDIPALVERQSDLQAYFALIYRCQQRVQQRAWTHPRATPERDRLDHVLDLLQARRDRTASDLYAVNSTILAAGGCPSCASGSPVPHKASALCRSGGRAHCTCDTCW